MPDNLILFNKFNKLATLAKATKIRRLLHNPIRYVSAQLFLKLIYPINKKGKIVAAKTFYDTPMELVLPAATDIFLIGGKSHESEIRLTHWLLKTLNEGDVFVDIGAHYGYFTLMASQLVGEKGKVFAYEAAQSTYQILKNNTIQSANIVIKHTAVTNAQSPIAFYEFPVLYSEYNTLDVEQFNQATWFKKNPPKKIEVSTTLLGDIINNHHPNIIKIDVEGAEYQVIASAKNVLSYSSPIIIMEYLHDERHNEQHNAAQQLLAQFKYSAH
ncbi:MAG: FkbM family methyltransferase, partial [Saprospiraceae bacterium]|nr:FkbM family methyltransferase [Saprospiraceae bacterium]